MYRGILLVLAVAAVTSGAPQLNRALSGVVSSVNNIGQQAQGLVGSTVTAGANAVSGAAAALNEVGQAVTSSVTGSTSGVLTKQTDAAVNSGAGTGVTATDGAGSGTTGTNGAGSGTTVTGGAGSGTTVTGGAGSGTTVTDGVGSGTTATDGAGAGAAEAGQAGVGFLSQIILGLAGTGTGIGKKTLDVVNSAVKTGTDAKKMAVDTGTRVAVTGISGASSIGRQALDNAATTANNAIGILDVIGTNLGVFGLPIRAAAGLSNRIVDRKVGLSKAVINRVESGSTSILNTVNSGVGLAADGIQGITSNAVEAGKTALDGVDARFVSLFGSTTRRPQTSP